MTVIKIGDVRLNTDQVVSVHYRKPAEDRPAKAVVTTTAGVSENASNLLIFKDRQANLFLTLYDAAVGTMSDDDRFFGTSD